MAENRTPTEARQGETGRSMLVVLLVSILLAAALAIGGYLYLFATPNAELDAPIPSTGSATAPATPPGSAAAPAAP